jgi:hypothetical protein
MTVKEVDGGLIDKIDGDRPDCPQSSTSNCEREGPLSNETVS